MLDFDVLFVSDKRLGCLVRADEPKYGRVQFLIGHLILIDVLGGGNPVDHKMNIELCEREQTRIRAACRQAFKERPNAVIGLQARDFMN